MYTPKIYIYIYQCVYILLKSHGEKEKKNIIYNRGNKEEIMKGRKMYLLPAITNAPKKKYHTHTHTHIISFFFYFC